MDFHKDSHEGFLYEIHTLGIEKTQARVSLGFRDLGPLVLGRSEREHLTVLSSKTPASPFSSASFLPCYVVQTVGFSGYGLRVRMRT